MQGADNSRRKTPLILWYEIDKTKLNRRKLNYGLLLASIFCIKDTAFISFITFPDLLKWLCLLKMMLLVVKQQNMIIV